MEKFVLVWLLGVPLLMLVVLQYLCDGRIGEMIKSS